MFSPHGVRRLCPYIHELPEWPEFRWDHKVLAEPLAAVRHRQGRLIGRMEGLGFGLRYEASSRPSPRMF
jgi:Fic family protein